MYHAVDFVVPYTENLPDVEGKCPPKLSGDILEQLTLRRIKGKKPTIILLTGGSGEAKSYTGLSIADELLRRQGVDFLSYLKDIEIFTPFEYGTKIKAMLYEERLKKVNVLILDEAREVVDSKKWFDFINQAVAHINAVFRRIKPLVIIIITHSIMDIDSSIRRSITYYGTCTRPIDKPSSMKLFKVWIDDYDLEKPKLRKRRIVGYIVKNGRYIRVKPTFRFHIPRKEIVDLYEDLNYESKGKIINRKIEMLLKSLDSEMKTANDKLEAMAVFYVEHPEMQKFVVEQRKGKLRVNKNFRKMHDLTEAESKEFEKILLNKFAEKGIAAPSDPVEVVVNDV
jgi:hypothetical protein